MQELQHFQKTHEYNSVSGAVACGGHMLLYVLEVVPVKRVAWIHLLTMDSERAPPGSCVVCCIVLGAVSARHERCSLRWAQSAHSLGLSLQGALAFPALEPAPYMGSGEACGSYVGHTASGKREVHHLPELRTTLSAFSRLLLLGQILPLVLAADPQQLACILTPGCAA